MKVNTNEIPSILWFVIGFVITLLIPVIIPIAVFYLINKYTGKDANASWPIIPGVITSILVAVITYQYLPVEILPASNVQQPTPTIQVTIQPEVATATPTLHPPTPTVIFTPTPVITATQAVSPTITLPPNTVVTATQVAAPNDKCGTNGTLYTGIANKTYEDGSIGLKGDDGRNYTVHMVGINVRNEFYWTSLDFINKQILNTPVRVFAIDDMSDLSRNILYGYIYAQDESLMMNAEMIRKGYSGLNSDTHECRKFFESILPVP